MSKMKPADAKSRATARGVRFGREDLRSSGGTVPLGEVCARLGVSQRELDDLVSSGKVLALQGAAGRRRFPAVQFDYEGRLLGGLAEIQDELGFASPWSVLNFLVNEHYDLGDERPVDVLRRGQLDRVLQVARLSGVHSV